MCDVESRARDIASNDGGTKRHANQLHKATTGSGAASVSDPEVRRIEEQLRRRLQTDVSVQALGNERGILRISFFSHDDLDRLLELMLGKTRNDFD